MIYVIDYGAGNLKSVFHALKRFTSDIKIVDSVSNIQSDIKGIILPGDGSFAFAFAELKKRGFVDFIQANVSEIPLLGICVGFQLLFESSTEDGGSEGLSLLKGKIKKIDISSVSKSKVDTKSNNDIRYKIPHMGWNTITLNDTEKSLTNRFCEGVQNNDFFYFIHSYYADEVVLSEQTMTCDYVHPFCCAVAKQNIVGYQFHPEKSAEKGMRLLENFLKNFSLS